MTELEGEGGARRGRCGLAVNHVCRLRCSLLREALTSQAELKVLAEQRDGLEDLVQNLLNWLLHSSCIACWPGNTSWGKAFSGSRLQESAAAFGRYTSLVLGGASGCRATGDRAVEGRCYL